MRRLLDRMTFVVVGVTAGLCLVLATGLVWWFVTQQLDEVVSWLDPDPLVAVGWFAAAMVLVVVVSAGAGFVATRSWRQRVEEASQQLLHLASRFANGEARLTPVHSGISEIDEVSGVSVPGDCGGAVGWAGSTTVSETMTARSDCGESRVIPAEV